MSCPLSSADIAELIEKLQKLEVWQKQVEQEQASSSTSRGYRRGDPKARAAAISVQHKESVFPALPVIAQTWKLIEEAGPAFIGEDFGSVEEGPGPVPQLVQDQAIFISWDQKDALQRVHSCYTAGFFARAAVECFLAEPLSPCELSSPAEHFIVLRAVGLSGPVRFASAEHFKKFKHQTFPGAFVAHGFVTETELQVFCQGGRIQVPPLFAPC